ncbi:uncharacterized protein LOC128961409 [Oppia nitens]|uniref:uncharacterized protein LOC128961409 n=1 Tax=Oppia nitens TaxID=1686743 RepID=UPI0023D9D54D|nr:uncharacterized protein LOC128961409 [Oppia nitens]
MGVKLMIGFILLAVVSSDMMRKSIVFDPKTPKVFYCPQEKPIDMSKMIVKAIPLEKLCEYGPNGLPKKAKSDCYNDIDESDYACAEKLRIEMRINPPNDTETTTTMIPTPDAPKHIKEVHVKHVNQKKSTKPKQNKKL